MRLVSLQLLQAAVGDATHCEVCENTEADSSGETAKDVVSVSPAAVGVAELVGDYGVGGNAVGGTLVF